MHLFRQSDIYSCNDRILSFVPFLLTPVFNPDVILRQIGQAYFSSGQRDFRDEIPRWRSQSDDGYSATSHGGLSIQFRIELMGMAFGLGRKGENDQRVKRWEPVGLARTHRPRDEINVPAILDVRNVKRSFWSSS
jgi:hypothetical protein